MYSIHFCKGENSISQTTRHFFFDACRHHPIIQDYVCVYLSMHTQSGFSVLINEYQSFDHICLKVVASTLWDRQFISCLMDFTYRVGDEITNQMSSAYP